MSDERASGSSAILADEQAEQALIGVLLQRPDAMRDAAQGLTADDFYYEKHRLLYSAIHALDEARQAIDTVTVVAHLARHSLLEAAGGPAYISRLRNDVPSIANAASYVGIVQDYSLRRRVVAAAREISRSASEESEVASALADNAVSSFMSLALSGSRSSVKPIQEPLKELIQQIEEQMSAEKKGALSGVPSGFFVLDKKTNGWQRGDLIILAARPGMGKTAFALNLLVNAAADKRGPTAGVIFSLEMGATQLAGRILSSMARVPSDRMRSGELSDRQLDSLYETVTMLKDLPIFIDETPSISISELSRKCRQLKHEHNLGFILIDYLQLMSGSTSSKISNREQEISDISRRLKALARELECPVIALSQLNRAVEQRADKRPMLSDLRESGAIEQDADIIVFLYRQIYYDRLTNKGGDDARGGGGGPGGAPVERVEMMPSRDGDDAEVIIAKHRSGETGTVMLTFHESFTLFTNRVGDAPPLPDDNDLHGAPTRGFDPDEDFGPPTSASASPPPPPPPDDDEYDYGDDDDDMPI